MSKGDASTDELPDSTGQCDSGLFSVTYSDLFGGDIGTDGESSRPISAGEVLRHEEGERRRRLDQQWENFLDAIENDVSSEEEEELAATEISTVCASKDGAINND